MTQGAPSDVAGGLKVALVVALVWLIALATMWNLGLPASRIGAFGRIAEDPEVVFGGALAAEIASPTRSRALDPAVLAAVRSDPLDERAILLAAIATTRIDAHNLLELARSRNPRNILVGALLLTSYGQRGDIPQAVSEASALARIDLANSPTYAQFIEQLAIESHLPSTIGRALKTSELLSTVAPDLARAGMPRDQLLALVAPLGGLARRPDHARWAGSLVSFVADRPDPPGAAALWEVLAAIPRGVAGRRVADPRLRGPAGTTPFGWTLPGDFEGVTFDPDGLHIYYTGRSNRTFARQLLLLGPGRYRLASRSTAAGDVGLNDAAWRVSCQEGGEPLATVTFAGVPTGSGTVMGSFAVPSANCTAQWLELVGVSPEVPRDEEGTIHYIQIDPWSAG